ncbi:MAG TPA: glycosyltransferase family 9 protein [Acidimicrobiales bacterium]|nr:glycosyltransferase family 9 protein [Acidimicrobiales bacterium]
MKASPPLLVILRALKLGDYLTGLPAIRALTRAFPGHRTVLLAPGWLAELTAHVGATDEHRHHPGLVSLPGDLCGADIAVDLHGCGPESQRLLLDSGPRRLIAFACPALSGTWGGPPWRSAEHEVTRWCRLLWENGIPADPDDLTISSPGSHRSIPTDATLIHPGAASAARRWPVARFAGVARNERDRGRPVIVTGGPGEEDLTAELATQTALPSQAVFGRLGLGDFASLVAQAGRVLCGDTGAAHLATALGTPSVVLHGPVSPRLWGPPPRGGLHVAIWAGESGDPHGATVHPGLMKVSVERVVDALSRLPTRPVGASPYGSRQDASV